MGTIGGNLLQSTRCWYWRLDFPCYLHGGDRCHAKAGQHREHAFFGNERCASAHPSDPAAALLALGARIRTDRRELDARRALPPADRRRPQDDDARAGRADSRARRSRGRLERLPEGDGPEAVGVRARRRRGGTCRRRDADRALGRRARPVAARLTRSPGGRNAASGNGLQGRDRPRADPACPRSALNHALRSAVLMRLRMLFLLLVATISGTVVGLADNARAGKPRAAVLPGSAAARRRHAAEPLPRPARSPRRVPGRRD